jgi:hypothetical protein
VSERERTAEELRAALHARGELGAELEPQVIDSFVERIEHRIAAVARERAPVRRKDRSDYALALAIVSLGVSIPLTAIAAVQAGIVGIVVVWIGIVLVNVAFSRRA